VRAILEVGDDFGEIYDRLPVEHDHRALTALRAAREPFEHRAVAS